MVLCIIEIILAQQKRGCNFLNVPCMDKGYTVYSLLYHYVQSFLFT